MVDNPAYKDLRVWRAEVAGTCGCSLAEPYQIGTWIRRDERLKRMVIDGHQSAVNG